MGNGENAPVSSRTTRGFAIRMDRTLELSKGSYAIRKGSHENSNLGLLEL